MLKQYKQFLPIKTIPQPQKNYKQSHPRPNTHPPTAKTHTHFTNNHTHDKTPKSTTELNDPWWGSTQPHHHQPQPPSKKTKQLTTTTNQHHCHPLPQPTKPIDLSNPQPTNLEHQQWSQQSPHANATHRSLLLVHT